MQLLVLVLMLMMSGKNANIKELKPIFEELGGGEAANAIKQAEELSNIISALRNVSPVPDCQGDAGGAHAACGDNCGEGYPLAPIANIADERITYCLSRYIALGE